MSPRDIRAAKIAVLIVVVVAVALLVTASFNHDSRAHDQAIEQLDR